MSLARNEFSQILNNELQFYISQISPGDGIALNEALCENIFMILVCILNKIPIFVVGKPGSSKSLAMELLTSNLNGKASESPFFRDLPAIEVNIH
jgi:E3 ubiquitin-protein ligase RNF213